MRRTLASHNRERQFQVLLAGMNFKKIPVNGTYLAGGVNSFRKPRRAIPPKCARQSRVRPDARGFSARQ
ncbi:hypothetical protein DF021_10395 [Burkholderia stagnalis]|uniref:Uncharacterized protein n=1 Tax=Burkholderia stagnalis TaxID=1503054 RepID=A0ABX9YTT1_9BURK|nr:hypothetical protein DF158_11115 [Burkholderia stagnalis]RQQ70823.1 hypothetical protein DF137_10240 [Burkholderia stagnalis]RQQ71969.1 hypothetical protein DF139_09345 [Burkholderia stagnalis]RQQ84262.1 hypothetical protein DF138_07610 [Burkholderia stagnalis]RQQ91795.1 hypothetical protein DF134_11640 [Burkholderia stagnalis]